MDLSISKLQTLLPIEKLLDRISFKVRLTGAISLFILLWTLFCLHALKKHEALQNLSAEVALLSAQAKKIETQKELHQKMQKQLSFFSKDYLTQKIESIPLLQGERKRVFSLSKHFPENLSLKERLAFLDSDQNRIRLDGSRTQMDRHDLRNFLEAVEADRYDLKAGKPFLLIKTFDLLKCYEKGDEKVYSIQVELFNCQ